MPKKKSTEPKIEEPRDEEEIDGEPEKEEVIIPRRITPRPSMMGRPLAFKTVKEMRERMDAYFERLWDESKGKWMQLPRKAGLAFACGIQPDTLRAYARGERGKDFIAPIKDAYTIIEDAWAGRLEDSYPTGAIFYLKNAFKDDYRDRYDHTSDGKEMPAPQIIIYGGADDRLAKVMQKRAKPA